MSVLIMLCAKTEQEALEVFTLAHEQAYEKDKLSFALALPEMLSEESAQKIAPLGHYSFIQSTEDPFISLYQLYHGEDSILMASEGMVFQKFWDLRLKKAFASLHKPKAALTGFLPDVCDLHGAVYPVAVDKVADGMIHFHKGTPLYRAVMPQRCAFINPFFCYAKPSFFECMATKSDTPAFLRPFENGYTLYTLHDPCIHTVSEQRIAPLPQPYIKADEVPDSAISRFVDTYHLPDSPSAILGIYTPDLQYDMDIPTVYKLKESFKQFTYRKSPVSPMFVAAYYDMTCPVPNVPVIYESRFLNLARLKNLPLALFIRGRLATSVKRFFHNVYDYQRAYGLSASVKSGTEYTRFKVAKCNLLLHASALFPHHTHYAYIDFGYQRFPIYGGAAIDFRPIMDDTIHLARVGGVLDTSLITVPKELVTPLNAMMTALIEEWLDQGLPLDDVALFQALYEMREDLFTIHDLPEKRGLFHKCMRLRKDYVAS